MSSEVLHAVAEQVSWTGTNNLLTIGDYSLVKVWFHDDSSLLQMHHNCPSRENLILQYWILGKAYQDQIIVGPCSYCQQKPSEELVTVTMFLYSESKEGIFPACTAR